MYDILYSFFPIHNIFKNKNKSKKFLNENIKEFLVSINDGKVEGTLRIVKRNEENGHCLINFKHIASKNKNKEILKDLIKYAEKNSAPGKIELHIAESEKPNKTFFTKLGYEVEGKLKNHYRPKETCYILGKTVKKH